MPQTPHRYTSPDEDSGRWLELPARPGDIVISTRSKHGTTWTQMICALLVFQTPDLPAPLSELSPWIDWLVVPQDEVFARLEAQEHRRFVKTHTPLDGVPLHPEARYIVVARHPLDAAVSLYHQGLNLDRDRIRELTGAPRPEPKPEAAEGEAPRPKRSLREWLVGWAAEEADPREDLDSLQGVMWHLSDAWARREEPNVLLVHYADLAADLEGEMRRIAAWLDVEVDEERWPELVRAATFAEMKSKADRVAPDPAGIMRSRDAFFRSGTSGSARDLLTGEELAAYRERVRALAPDDLLEWLHRPVLPTSCGGRSAPVLRTGLQARAPRLLTRPGTPPHFVRRGSRPGKWSPAAGRPYYPTSPDGLLVMATKSLVEQAWSLPPRHQVRCNQRRTTQSTCEVKNPTSADIAIFA